LPNQFKAAEVNAVPFSVILGEDEVAQGKVKIKENGLREGHPEKDGVVVNLEDLVSEVKQRLKRKADLDNMAQKAGGLRVVGGIKDDKAKTENATEEPAPATSESAESPKPTEPVSETEKPKEESPLSQEAIGAIPAS
jgi:histidyl-tRNA synthetase